MIADRSTCAICLEPIDDRSSICERREGWVPLRRSAGGTNQLRAAQCLDQWGHAKCVGDIDAGRRSRPEAAVPWVQLPLF